MTTRQTGMTDSEYLSRSNLYKHFSRILLIRISLCKVCKSILPSLITFLRALHFLLALTHTPSFPNSASITSIANIQPFNFFAIGYLLSSWHFQNFQKSSRIHYLYTFVMFQIEKMLIAKNDIVCIPFNGTCDKFIIFRVFSDF